MSARWNPAATVRAMLRDRGGAVAVLTALLLPVLIGIAAYAVDASLLLYRQERLQIATDIGAVAAARLLSDGESEARAVAMAEALVIANDGADDTAPPTVDVTRPAPDRLAVEARLPVPRIFSQIFGSGDLTVTAGALVVIAEAPAPAACIHLDGPKNKALTLDRDSLLNLVPCGIDIAASRPISADLKRGARLTSGCLTMAGRVNGAHRVQSDCPGIREDATIPDPRPIPTAPQRAVACADWASGRGDADEKGKDKDKDKGNGRDRAGGDAAAGGSEPAQLPPATPVQVGPPQVCLSETEIARDTEGGPGIYFIEDSLKIVDGATLTLGPGAVIVLLDRAEIEMDDDAGLVVTAPESGPLAGMAIMQGHGRDRPGDRDHELGRIEITGRIALPREEIEIAGASTSARCTRLHAGSLALERDAVLDIACADSTGGGGTVRLAPTP